MSERERMKYGILGEDTQTPGEKIDRYTGEVGWSYLRPHYLTGALLWVDPALELAEVARAMQADEADRVANWLGSGDLVKVGELHARQWEGGGEVFTAVVVTPFVLMQQRVAD